MVIMMAAKVEQSTPMRKSFVVNGGQNPKKDSVDKWRTKTEYFSQQKGPDEALFVL